MDYIKSVNQTMDNYDRIPYIGDSYPSTHIRHLWAMGNILGVNPTPPPRARTMEIGSACGYNIFPQAVHFPNAYFLGIDLSAKHTEQAEQMREMLQCNNVEFRCANIVDVKEPPHSFDYIICHGVFSWVPLEVRDSILQLIKSCLTPNGLALISYNCSPGWVFGTMMRNYVSLYDNHSEPHDIRLKVMQEKANEFYLMMKKTRPELEPFFASELNIINTYASFYVLHEFGEPENQPLLYTDFVEDLHQHGLQIASDISMNDVGNHGDIQDLLHLPEYKRKAAFLQADDLKSLRRFRHSVVMHEEQSSILTLKDILTRIRQVSFDGISLTKEVEDGVTSYHVGKKASIKSTNDINKYVLEFISARPVEGFQYKELLADLIEKQIIQDTEKGLAKFLWKLVQLNILSPVYDGINAYYTIDEKPKLHPLTRYSSFCDSAFLFNALGLKRKTGEFINLVARQIDGNSTHDQILANIRSAMGTKEIKIMLNNDQEYTFNQNDANLDNIYRSTLETLCQNNCLVRNT